MARLMLAIDTARPAADWRGSQTLIAADQPAALGPHRDGLAASWITLLGQPAARAKSIAAHTAATWASLHCAGVARGLSG